MNSSNFSDQNLLDQAGTWDNNQDPTFDFDLFPDQPLLQHQLGCPTLHEDVDVCLHCNFLIPFGGQGQAARQHGWQQYSHSASYSATNTPGWTQANMPRSQQYPFSYTAPPTRSALTQQVPSRQFNVASAASAGQSRVAFEADPLYSTYNSRQLRSAISSLPASYEVQQYHSTLPAVRQPNVRSSGQISRQIPGGEGLVGLVSQQHQQQQQHWPGFNRLSLQTIAGPFLKSQLSSGLALPTDYQAPSINSVPQNVASWNTQPRVPGDRTTIPSTAPQYLQPVAQSSPISENSSSGNSRRRSATEMRLVAGEYQYQCTYPECLKTYPKAGELTKHERRCHGDPAERPHACPVSDCPCRFNYPREVRRHQASIHEESNEFFCPYDDCPYFITGFARDDHLERHLRTKHRGAGASALVSLSRTSSSLT